MSWAAAHRVAHIAAVQAHHDLGVVPDRFPVPVADAIEAAGLPLMWRPMDQLFGVYLHVGDQRGILVNEGLTRAGRRHTAAHELGHHRFVHHPDPGSPCAVDVGEPAQRQHRWTPDEQVAESFASWFLMPRKAVLAALACLGLDRPDSAATVYQLSLLLGTTYRATVRHLVSLRLADPRTAQGWASKSPAALKRRLLIGPLTSTRDVDVWNIQNPCIPGARHLSPGDRVGVPRHLLLDTGGLPSADNGADSVAVTGSDPGVYKLQFCSGQETVELALVVEPRPHGLHRKVAGPTTSAVDEVTV